MRVLVACEESQAVTKEFRARGHEAYSNDILPCSGGHPEWHIQGDALEVINDPRWDLMIAHPTCTFIANSGVRHLHTDENRWNELRKACEFFRRLLNCKIPKKALENPIPHKYAIQLIGRKYDQLIQPWMFGHTESKATCFWLEGLPKLTETCNVKYICDVLPKNRVQKIHHLPPSPERRLLRSKTFTGIAKAMAEQWG